MQSKTQKLSSPSEGVSWPARGSACLVHIYPATAALGTRYPLDNIPWMIGQDANCDLRLNDETVSRRHALIQPEPDGFSVTDLQSTNGTYVNDLRVSRGPLQSGDTLRIGVTMFRFLAGEDLEAAYREEIYRLTIYDALTDLPNKRYFQEFLGRALGYGIRYRQPLALIVFDPDHFKALNERINVLGGDFALRNLANLLRRCVRREDLLARYEGPRFAIVLPGTNRDGAMVLAERLRQLIATQIFQYEGTTYQMTISVGVSALTGQDWQTSTELIDQAQTQLLLAKQQGRNRVVG